MAFRTGPRRHRRSRADLHLGVWMALLPPLLLALPAQATAQVIVIPDPIAAPDREDIAAAVSLLVRASFQQGPRTIAPRRQLALAIEALTGRSPSKNLTVASAQAPKLLQQLGADSLVLWELQVGEKSTQVGGTLVGPNGKRLLRLSAAAATGDVGELARQLAQRVASYLGVGLEPTPDLGLADMRPFAQAQAALLVQDGVAVSRALDLALPKVAAGFAGPKQVLREIADDPGMAPLPRAQAAVLMGDWDRALERADAGLASDGKNILLRVAKVRALAARGDFQSAEREIQALKSAHNPSVLALAQVAVGLERGDSPEKLTEALAPLVGRPPADWRPLLPLIASSKPGSFGARGEAAALAAAEKLSQQEPGLAGALATRALAGGATPQETAPLIKLQDLSAGQVKTISGRLGDEGGAAADLSRQIRAREEEAKQIAAAAGPEKPTGPPSALASSLRAVLQDFDALYEPTLNAIQIAPLPGSGQPFYWPFLIRKQRLGEGLLEALMRSPWELHATVAKVQTETLGTDQLSDEGMVTIAHDTGAAAVLFYRARPAGLAPWATLELFLYDSSHQRIDKIETQMMGRSTGLMVLSPLWIALMVLAGLGLFSWALVVSLRGTVVVRVQWDSDAKDEMFSILISKSPNTPTVENITVYRKKMEWIGKRKRRFEAWNIDQNTTFRGIPRGKWNVHLYGIYTRGRQTLPLKEPPQEVEVHARKSAFVAHVLEAAEAEFKILVVDKQGPVDDARVWLDDQRARAAAAKNGTVVLKVPKGYHVIHVSARGMEVERPYHVVKAKVHEMTINLVWEKRQEYVSRALERQVDDAAVYMTKSPRRQSAATSIPLSPASAEPVAERPPPAPARSAQHAGPGEGIEIRLQDTPAVASASKPALTPQAAPRASSSKPVVGRQTVSLKPLSPELDATAVPATLPPTRQAAHSPAAPPASASESVDLHMVPESEAPVDLPPVELLPPVDSRNPRRSDPSVRPAPPTPGAPEKRRR
jgi:hypothetical protein